MATTMENTDNVSSKKIKIQSNDGETFEIDQDIIEQSSTIKELLDVMNVADAIIPLNNVKASFLIPIIEFCTYHKNDKKADNIDDDEDDDDPNKDAYEPKRSDNISDWDMNFIQQFTVQDGSLVEIISAANYLDIKTLLAVGLKTIANMVRGKSSSEVRTMFDISFDPPGEGINAIENASEVTSST